MSLDPYALCPCGSGKKFKFCCVELGDSMEKVLRHRDLHQPRMALGVLDKLEKRHPDNAWVLIERASIHIDEEEFDEAREVLDRLLASNPHHEMGIVLRAIVAFDSEDFSTAKQHINAAFLRGGRAHAEVLSDLALGVASLMNAADKHMAARHYLTLAMRLAPSEQQQEIFLALLRFDSSRECPYPLRSVHLLANYEGAADLKSQAADATRLAALGCCEPAAEAFTRLGEEQPDNALFWQNAGLCRAWGGDEESAADALHLAAELHDDFDAAVELETLAQLLDLANTDDVIHERGSEYTVRSVSQLLSQLPQHPRIVRTLLSAYERKSDQFAGEFRVLDRDVPEENDQSFESITIDNAPVILAQVVVFSADPDNDLPARAVISGPEGEPFDTARKQFEEAAGDTVEIVKSSTGEESTLSARAIPAQFRLLHRYHHFPQQMPGVRVDKLMSEEWQQVIDESWMNEPQEALRGKSPREAKGDADLRLPLTAAVYVLDALCDKKDFALDLNAVCGELNVTPQSPLEVADDAPLTVFSAMHLNRIQVKTLNDEQLVLVLNRSLLIHHSRFLYDVLIEALDRPQCAAQIDRDRAHMTLVDLCRNRFRHDEAIEWTEKAIALEVETPGENPFERTLKWKLRLLTLRLTDPDDPQLMPLIEEVAIRYAPKIPGLRDKLEELCELSGVSLSGRALAAVADSASGAPDGGGVWSPQSAGQGAGSGGEKKLWLPGQS